MNNTLHDVTPLIRKVGSPETLGCLHGSQANTHVKLKNI